MLSVRRVGDLEQLIARDHAELDRLVRYLIEVEMPEQEWRHALEGVQLGFAAHAGATERLINDVLACSPTLRGKLLDDVLTEHRDQETLLEQLRNGTNRGRIEYRLRAALLAHDEHDRLIVLPALRATLSDDEYDRVTRVYAAEYSRALGQMRPLASRVARGLGDRLPAR